MNNTSNVSNLQGYNLQAYNFQASVESDNKSIDISQKSITVSNEEATYSATSLEINANYTYTPDMDKVNEMKEESESRLFELMKKSVQGGFTKQANSLEKFLGGLSGNSDGSNITGTTTNVSISINIEITTAEIEESSETQEIDDYWNAENTSDRLIDFAKALSGGDSSKADLLRDAFLEGFQQAQELWGGELPEVSRDTYDLTLEKFSEWENEGAKTTEVTEEI